MSDRLLIVDFGSQVTQLIARRLREAGVYCEIHPFQSVDQAKIEQFGPKAIVLSGGPASVIEGQAPSANPAIFTAQVPVLGICYGEQTMAKQLGGAVEAGHHREFGRAELLVKSPSALFDGVWQPGDKKQVWMSHGDRVTRLPPGFSVIATSENAPFAAISDEARKFYAVQFHPEVMHTPDGAKLLRNFALNIAGFKGDWTMARLQGARHRPDPRPGGQGPGDLRPVGRRRFIGRGRAAARGDRRPAAVRVRRPRPAAARRGRAGGPPVPRPLQHPAGPRRRLGDLPEGARRRHRPRDQAQDDRRAVHRRLRSRGEEDRRRQRSSPRARSIPT